IWIAICRGDEGDHTCQISSRANRKKDTAATVARRHRALQTQRNCISESVVCCRVGVIKIAAQQHGWIAEVAVDDVLKRSLLVVERFIAGQACAREAESDKRSCLPRFG